ncbi:hypothetical protein Moror_3043, partial [Moniliophthora roreri MCA 2997]
MKKSYKGKRQNTFVAAFDEGEEVVNMAFATAIDEEGGTSDEAENSEMETQMEYSDQYLQTSDEEDTPDVETLSLASGRRSSAPLHQQSIVYQSDNGELISDQEVKDPFRSDDRLSLPITGNDNNEEDELESFDDSFHTVPQGDEEKENTPPEPVEAVTPPMNSTGYYPQLNPSSHLETNVYCRSGPITLVPSFPDPSVPNNFSLHALREHHLIPLTNSTPHIIVPNPLFIWINSLDEFLAQFPDEFAKLGMIKMQYIINEARQEGLLDKPCIQTYLEMMYLAICKPMVYGHLRPHQSIFALCSDQCELCKHKIEPWSQHLGMGVYVVIREKPNGARYWTYCTPPEYLFNNIPQPVDALLHVLGLDEPFMTDELILMELHCHPEAKCLSTCPICSNYLCQGKYHGEGLYYLGQTVVNNSDELPQPLPIIGNPVDLTIVYKDRIPEFYTELPEPAKPFIDSRALYCTTCRESHTLDIWAEESKSRNPCHTALVHIPHYEDFPTKSFHINMDQTGLKPGESKKWPPLNVNIDTIKKGKLIRYFHPGAAQRQQDTKPHLTSWRVSVIRMQRAEKCKRIEEQAENDDGYYASPVTNPPSSKKGKMGESSTSRAFCSWHNTTHSETDCSDVETETVSKEAQKFFSEISGCSIMETDPDSTFLKKSRDIVDQSVIDTAIRPRSNEFLENLGPLGSTLPPSETLENSAGLSQMEPTWPNTATTPWTDLNACGWHGMHRPESACSLTHLETWSQMPSWVDGPPMVPVISSPESLHVPPPQGSSNITGAVIHNPTPEYAIVPTFQTGEIPVELKHSDKQFVLRQSEDPNDAPHNVTFITGNENCISSFYNPLVAPTPPSEVARWEEENRYNYEQNKVDYYD